MPRRRRGAAYLAPGARAALRTGRRRHGWGTAAASGGCWNAGAPGPPVAEPGQRARAPGARGRSVRGGIRTGDQQLQPGLSELLPVARVLPGIPGVARPPHRGPRGHPAIAWGKLDDGTPPTDVVNPRDWHDPFVVDEFFEEQKIGIQALLGTQFCPTSPVPGSPICESRRPGYLGSPRATAARARALVPAIGHGRAHGALRAGAGHVAAAKWQLQGRNDRGTVRLRHAQRRATSRAPGRWDRIPPPGCLEGHRPGTVALHGARDRAERDTADRRLQSSHGCEAHRRTSSRASSAGPQCHAHDGRGCRIADRAVHLARGGGMVREPRLPPAGGRCPGAAPPRGRAKAKGGRDPRWEGRRHRRRSSSSPSSTRSNGESARTPCGEASFRSSR